MTVRKNDAFAKELKGQRGARFCLCDFHVHSPASYDVVSKKDLNEFETEHLKEFIGSSPKNLIQHQNSVLAALPPAEYLEHLTKRRDDVVDRLGVGEYNQWAVVAVTDHNICSYAVQLSRAAWESRKTNKLIVLPGVELDVVFPISTTEKAWIHVLCIFSPDVNEGDMRIAICDASSMVWKEGADSLEVSSLQDFIQKLRHHQHYPSMVIAAHVGSSKGVQKEVKRLLTAREAEIAQIEAELGSDSETDKKNLNEQLEKLKEISSENDIAAGVLKTIGECGFDALQVRSKSDEKHYRRLHRYHEDRGRSVPVVFSDAHCLDHVFQVSGDFYPQLKLTNEFNKLNERCLFDEIKNHAIRCGETRFSYTYGGEVTHWIEGIEIVRDSESATTFWSNPDGLVMPFSRNLNCVIGGRGSGKSAIIEALSFVLNPIEAQVHSGKPNSKLEAWYKRARSTLSGCNLRLCWRAFGDVEKDFRKGVFVSRYFDPNDRHGSIVVTNVEGDTLIFPEMPSVQLYRFHDIERAAETGGLRKLIDEVSGGISEIEEAIESVRSELAHKSADIVAVAREINELTKDGSPLRCFAKRSFEYARVNKKEVEQHFKKLDAVEQSGKTLKNIRGLWDRISIKFSGDDLTEIEKLISDISDVCDVEKDNYLKGLSSLINGDNALILKFLASFQELLELKDKTETEFALHRQDIVEKYTSLRGELEKDGVPTGAKDREARKNDLDSAMESLNEYRNKLQVFDRLCSERKALFEELKSNCKNRTDIRVETAERITHQLSQDLDESIIQIYASAQPAADMSAFAAWLERNLTGLIQRYRPQRIDSLLKGGLTPEVLRDLLLDRRHDWNEVLVRKESKASDGKVSEEDAQAIVTSVAAVTKYDPEMSSSSENVEEVFYSELPNEIKEGLCHFHYIAGGNALRLEEILKLDEIVFDDIPLVYLIDRPQEQGSKPRPLHELSPGQRCSAVLPILLLNGRSPLIIDQPEDNLDNRLIRQVIVNVLGSIKLRRQVIVATHNPNIPVLGDAEQTIVLAAIDEKQSMVRTQGNLDSRSVVDAVTEIMEGGREAFQYRHTIYLSHWDGILTDA